MYSIRLFATAGVVAVALAAAPVIEAQTQGSGSSQSPSGSSQPQSPSGSTESQSPSGSSQSPSSATGQSSAMSGQSSEGGNQEVARQHLATARTSIEELTKLPAAAQLQGEQRTQIAEFISAFNAFATSTTDWRAKYSTVDRTLDRMLEGSGAEGSASASDATSGSASPASGSTGTAGSTEAGAAGSAEAGGSGDFDPTIAAKLRDVRNHLDRFEEASGDPLFIVEKIEERLERALNASASAGSAAVGTSGTTGTSGSDMGAGASASGTVTVQRSDLEEIRRQVELLRKRFEQ